MQTLPALLNIKTQAKNIFYAGLVIMVIGLPLSKFLTGLSLFVLIGAWILDGNYRQKFELFKQSKVALALSAIFFLHLAGLLWTSDFEYALNDIRVKLPLILLPLLLSSIQPKENHSLKIILNIFVSAVVLSTIISTGIRFEWWGNEIDDIRDISIFISHIRFALLICLSIFICLVYFFKKAVTNSQRFLYGIAAVWLIVFLFILNSITGLSILLICGLVLGFHAALKKRSDLKGRIMIVLIPVICISLSISWLMNEWESFKKTDVIDLASLPAKTINGNPYNHYTDRTDRENGHYIYLYISNKELYHEWNKKSTIHPDSVDKSGYPLYGTLLRYLTSKNLTKDSAGIAQLSAEDVKAVENGVANVDLVDFGIRSRVHQIFWELEMYMEKKVADGSSVAMRLEFWKAALFIINDHPLIGVGTGDVKQAFHEKYIEINSGLSEKWRLRAHNQYLSFTVAFGITGLFIFLLCLWMIFRVAVKDTIFFSFFLIAIISMFTEDTLETQAGVTFFALFTCLLVYCKPAHKKQNTL